MLPDSLDHSPVSQLFDKEAGRQILRLLLGIFLAGGLALLAVGLFDDARGTIMQAWLTLLLCAISYLLMRRNLYLAGQFVLWSLWLTILFSAFLTSGNRSTGLIGLPLLVVLCGWTVGIRPAIWMTALTTLTLFGFATHEAMGGHYAGFFPPLHRWLVQSLFILAGAVFATHAVRQYWQHRAKQLELSRHLSTLVDHVPACVCSVDIHHRYIYANRLYANFFGKEPEEIIGMHLWDVIGKDNFAARREVFDAARKGTAQHYRRDHIDPGTGLRKVIDVDLIPEFESDGKTVTRYFGLLREMTEEVVATEEAKKSEERFAALFRASPVATSISRMEDGLFIDVNRAYEEMYGTDRASLIGQSPVRIGFWPSEAHRAAWLATLGDGRGRHDYEVQIRTTRGELKDLLLTSERIDLDGVPHLLTLHSDITARKAAEREIHHLNETLEQQVQIRTAELTQALQHLERSQEELIRAEKLSALGGMVAGLAHELNTPIGNAVTVASTMHEQAQEFLNTLNSGEALRKSSLLNYCETSVSGADVLLRNLDRAHNLIRNFKQVAVDQTSESRRIFLLDQTIGEIISSMSPALRHRPFHIETDIATHIELDSYPGAIGQILINLINNSILHGFDGRDHGLIRITAAMDGDNPQRVRLTVEDDGNGIAPEFIGRVFEPFFTTKLGKGGSGLGLSIIYNIVNGLLGGEIQCHSILGHGTRFTLLLPLIAPAPGE